MVASIENSVTTKNTNNINMTNIKNKQQLISPTPSVNPLLILTVKAAEHTWLSIASLANSISDQETLQLCLEHILRLNPFNTTALWQYGRVFEQKGQYIIAAEAYLRILKNNPNNNLVVDVLAALGRCYLMLDELGKAYQTFQQSLLGHQTLLTKLDGDFWFWIGFLYDRYGSENHALEAFAAAAKAPKAPLAEIYFKIGIIMRNRGKNEISMNCFKYVLMATASPKHHLNHHPNLNIGPGDVLLQMAIVEDTQGEYSQAKKILEKLASEVNPRSVKVRLFLAWLYARPGTPFYHPEQALSMLLKCIDECPDDALSWYYLGRLHKHAERFPLAYEAYQKAVHKDSRNCAFWNSIGLLYAEIGQIRDSLDAYTRALQLAPNCATLWYNLAALYESSGNDCSESLKKAQELDVTGEEIHCKELDPLRFSGRAPVPISPQRPVNTCILASLPSAPNSNNINRVKKND